MAHPGSGRSRRARRRRPGAAVALLGAALLLAGCTPPGLPDPQPPDPLVSSTATTRTSGSAGTSASAPSAQPGQPGSSALPGTVTTGLTDGAAPGEQPSLTVGVDAAATGFNPYVIGDASAVTTAIAALTLPSVSRVADDGTVQLDPDVVTSAEVTGTDPFQVTYQLSRSASWSDGTPVTAEDFRYLADQLSSQLGVRDAAAYTLVRGIDSTEGGKTVRVTFASPVADWRTLFSPLLPAHILKDAPGGFAGGLADGIPVSAGPYRVASVDRVTGLITVRRNDKYWGTRPGPAGLVLRTGSAGELVAALRRGDIQAVLLQPGSTAAAQLDSFVPSRDRTLVPVAGTVQLVADATAGVTASPELRRAVAAGIDPDVVADALTGSRDDGLLPAGSPVELPADGGPRTRPAGVFGDLGAAGQLLQRAGWTVGDGAYARRDGVPLTLTLGYRAGDTRLAAAAAAVQDQLGRAGIAVDVSARTDVVAGLAATDSSHLDLALLTVPRGPSDAVEALSQFGCAPATAPTSTPTTDTPGPTTGTPSPTVTSSATAPATAATGDAAATSGSPGSSLPDQSAPASGTAGADDDGEPLPDTIARHGANLSGWCDPGREASLLAAVGGDDAGLAGLAAAVWQQGPVLTLGQPRAVFAVAPAMRGVLPADLAGSPAGWAWTGPLAGLPAWRHD